MWFNCNTVNTNSCAGRTVRANKLKRRSLEQRKVYRKPVQGDEVAHALKSLELLEGFRQSILKGQEWGWVAGYVISLCTIL